MTFVWFGRQVESIGTNDHLIVSAMDAESGGSLWRTLAVEEDVLKSVLEMLNPDSLKNLELTCRAFQSFIRSDQTWQKRFMKIKFHTFKYSTRMQILVNLTKPNSPSELHVKYKRICLGLELSLKSERCQCRLCTNQKHFFPRCDSAQIKRAMFHQLYQRQIDVEDEDFPMM